METSSAFKKAKESLADTMYAAGKSVLNALIARFLLLR